MYIYLMPLYIATASLSLMEYHKQWLFISTDHVVQCTIDEYHKQWLFISTDHIVLCCTMLLCTTEAGWKCIVTHYPDMMYCCIIIATTTVVTVPRALCQQLCTHYYNYVAQECPCKANLYIHVMVSLFIRCTMRCEIWAQPAQLVERYV